MRAPSRTIEGDSERVAAARAIRLALVIVGAIIVAGLAAIPLASAPNYQNYSLFFEQFARIELPALLVAGAFVVALWRRSGAGVGDVSGEVVAAPFFRWMQTRHLVLATVVIVWLGVRFVFRGYAFTDDEYAAFFQSQIFAHGRAVVPIPPQWCKWDSAISPTSVLFNNCQWRLAFLPLHSLFRAPFVALGIDEIGGAVTAAASLGLVVSISRKVWPDHPRRAWLAGLFFAASTQVLFMSMTFFSMPTHLLFSLAWLWLYVDNRRWSLVLLPWVGVLAMGLHSPFPHAFFVFVFLLRYVFDRRLALFAYVTVVYVAGLLFWQAYVMNITSAASSVAAAVPGTATATVAIASKLFALPKPELQLAAIMHLAVVVTWSSPIVVPLAAVAMLRWKRLDTFSRDAAAGIIFIVLARIFLTHSPQGVGWGYRWIHDAMGTLSMLAAIGAETLALAVGWATARRWILASACATALIQLPLRAINVAQIIRPYQRASALIASRRTDVVVFPTDYVAWGRQLMRNDPFFRTKPLMVEMHNYTVKPAFYDSMRVRGVSVTTITPEELQATGLRVWPIMLGRIRIAP
jgi:hypothetical protein